MASIAPFTESPSLNEQHAWRALSRRSNQIRQTIDVIQFFTDPQQDRRRGGERRAGALWQMITERRSRQERRIPPARRLLLLQFELQELMRHQDSLRLLQSIQVAP